MVLFFNLTNLFHNSLIIVDGGKMEVYDIGSTSQCYSVNVCDGTALNAVKVFVSSGSFFFFTY